MRKESLAFALSGTLFGLLVGWIIGSQQGGASPSPVATTTTPAASPAPNLDTAAAVRLEQQAEADPSNAAVRVSMGNLYFDAERFDQAIPWYEAALALNPNDVNVSTDLAVAYYYSNQTGRALAQIDQSLAVDPEHLKTLLNQGIIRAFGDQDLEGAAESWERVVALAPDSDEGRRAQQGLDGLRAAHASTEAGGQ
jgi:cytochrome c-type biogenesis protein CcmH/NrfG